MDIDNTKTQFNLSITKSESDPNMPTPAAPNGTTISINTACPDELTKILSLAGIYQEPAQEIPQEVEVISEPVVGQSSEPIQTDVEVVGDGDLDDGKVALIDNDDMDDGSGMALEQILKLAKVPAQIEESILIEVSSMAAPVQDTLHRLGSAMLNKAEHHTTQPGSLKGMKDNDPRLAELNRLSTIGEKLVSLGEPFAPRITDFTPEDLEFIAGQLNVPYDKFKRVVGIREGVAMRSYQGANVVEPMSKKQVQGDQPNTNNSGENGMVNPNSDVKRLKVVTMKEHMDSLDGILKEASKKTEERKNIDKHKAEKAKDKDKKTEKEKVADSKKKSKVKNVEESFDAYKAGLKKLAESSLMERHNGITFTKDPNGNLTFHADDQGKEEIKELLDNDRMNWYSKWAEFLDPFQANGMLYSVWPEEVGALTDAPMVSDQKDIADNGDIENIGDVWYYNDYALRDPLEELLKHGSVVFNKAPDAEPDEVEPEHDENQLEMPLGGETAKEPEYPVHESKDEKKGEPFSDFEITPEHDEIIKQNKEEENKKPKAPAGVMTKESLGKDTREPRELAPIATIENCEQLFRNARDTGSMLEFREEGSRKHRSVDSFSVSAVNQVFDKVKPEVKEKIILKCKGNCSVVAGYVWELLGKLKKKTNESKEEPKTLQGFRKKYGDKNVKIRKDGNLEVTTKKGMTVYKMGSSVKESEYSQKDKDLSPSAFKKKFGKERPKKMGGLWDAPDGEAKKKSDVNEAENHLGEKEFQTFGAWKAACKKINPEVQFDGDKDICFAKGVGEWDGATGVVYKKKVAESDVSLFHSYVILKTDKYEVQKPRFGVVLKRLSDGHEVFMQDEDAYNFMEEMKKLPEEMSNDKLDHWLSQYDQVMRSPSEVKESGWGPPDSWLTTDPNEGRYGGYDRALSDAIDDFDMEDFLKDYGDEFMWADAKDPQITKEDLTYPAKYIISSLTGYIERYIHSHGDEELENVDVEESEVTDLFNEKVRPFLVANGYTITADTPPATPAAPVKESSEQVYADDDVRNPDYKEEVYFHNGMKVRLVDPYAGREAHEIFRLSQWDEGSRRGWVGDKNGRGWYVKDYQIEPVDDESTDEVDEASVSGVSPGSDAHEELAGKHATHDSLMRRNIALAKGIGSVYNESEKPKSREEYNRDFERDRGVDAGDDDADQYEPPHDDDKEEIEEALNPKSKIKNALSTAFDTVSFRKDGTIVAKRIYFYRHGMTPESLVAAIERRVPGAKILDSGDHFARYPAESYMYVHFTTPEYKEKDEIAAPLENLDKPEKQTEFSNPFVERESKMSESTPPGQEHWVKSNKKKFKKEYGDKKGEEVLYATAWKRAKESLENLTNDLLNEYKKV